MPPCVSSALRRQRSASRRVIEPAPNPSHSRHIVSRAVLPPAHTHNQRDDQPCLIYLHAISLVRPRWQHGAPISRFYHGVFHAGHSGGGESPQRLAALPPRRRVPDLLQQPKHSSKNASSFGHSADIESLGLLPPGRLLPGGVLVGVAAASMSPRSCRNRSCSAACLPAPDRGDAGTGMRLRGG